MADGDGGEGQPRLVPATSRRIVVVGSGTRFLSGISVYSVRLANALAARHRVALVTMRSLLPARLYPGRGRVGIDLARLEHDPTVSVFDGVDWYWLPSIARAGWFLWRQRPEIVILQWWTGTVAHSYIALAVLGRMLGAKVIVEFHEIVETGEAGIPFARRYISIVAPILFRLAHAFSVHSEFDRQLAQSTWRLGRRRPVAVLPHGPHDHYQQQDAEPIAPIREAPADACNILFFGVIRPYKGLEHLVAAFEAIPDAELDRYWLTVVGETWEGWTRPVQMIAASRRRERITFVNRYVTDGELHAYLAGADAVALPYLRSSLSGPLHVAMGYGLPIVMTEVGGNAEAAEGYGGIVLIPPADPDALLAALRRLREMTGTRFAHPRSWDHTARAYEELFERLERPSSSP